MLRILRRRRAGHADEALAVTRPSLSRSPSGDDDTVYTLRYINHVTYSPVTHCPSTDRPRVHTVPQVRDPERQAEQRLAFGQRLRRLRTARELTQEQLAHGSGLDRTYVGAVENGRRNLSLQAMWQLADALQVGPDAFFCAELSVDGHLAARGDATATVTGTSTPSEGQPDGS